MGRDPAVDFKRRLVLQGALAAGSLFLPVPYAYVWALSEGALTLIRAPKIALVIGNSKYKDAVVLKNPANDAKAIADTLKQVGFDVTTKLDACRENPFGRVRIDQKGLSQMDAPQGTLLAYATSPGNLASDGEGANGLYTENLLREMKVKEAKIEDVFKRVRLSVRRKSNGAHLRCLSRRRVGLVRRSAPAADGLLDGPRQGKTLYRAGAHRVRRQKRTSPDCRAPRAGRFHARRGKARHRSEVISRRGQPRPAFGERAVQGRNRARTVPLTISRSLDLPVFFGPRAPYLDALQKSPFSRNYSHNRKGYFDVLLAVLVWPGHGNLPAMSD